MHLQILAVLLPFVLLVLESCSSMESSSAAESFGNQVPADFKWQEFDELNPEIRLMQVARYFKISNNEYFVKLCEEDGTKCGGAASTIRTTYENKAFTGSGIGIEIAKEYLGWSDKMIGLAEKEQKDYLYKFLLYGRQGEEKKVIDSLMLLVDKDSTIFYKNYVHYGKSQGMAYRLCKPDELNNTKSSLEGLVDYSKYRFCAETATQPLKIYVIP
ncbi:MAG: hypothetical protein LBH25_03895 [Fibromonadaceae bacterium]|jgi:hypothetical protein|nr:hypothetical protein [Fibromonadaceae bacterium]